ncbi:PocR ligand-binding domain-containing protein [Chloroflexota bacterium]
MEKIIDSEIAKYFLDEYSQATKLPIGLYERGIGLFSAYSKDVFSGFCNKLRDYPQGFEACEDDHNKRAKKIDGGNPNLNMCHVGLWNIGYPIIIGNDHIATLLCGQRLLSGEIEESTKQFYKGMAKLQLPESDVKTLYDSFINIKQISEDQFKALPLKHLQKIGQYIYRLSLNGIQIEKKARELQLGLQVTAHQFLLPIQAITADAEFVIDEAENGSKCNFVELLDATRDINNEMKRLYILAENMRSTYLIDRQYAVEFRIASLYKPLVSSWNTYLKEATAKGIKLNKPFCYSRNFPEIAMSYPDIERACMNIIGNAVKYSYAGLEEKERYIDIICSPGYPMCSVVVSNFGVGILKEEIESGDIFKPGYRGELSGDRERIGSGLGLGEAKRIIEELHKGQLSIVSENKGSAYLTTVTMKIPIKQEQRSNT